MEQTEQDVREIERDRDLPPDELYEGETLHIDGCTLASDHDGPCQEEGENDE